MDILGVLEEMNDFNRWLCVSLGLDACLHTRWGKIKLK
jgi:hypothetical protein